MPAREPARAGTIWTDFEPRAPFPVVGVGWITRPRKMPIIASRSASIGLPRAQGDRGSLSTESWPRGSTSATRSALNGKRLTNPGETIDVAQTGGLELARRPG